MRILLILLVFTYFGFDAHAQRKEDLMSSKPQYGFIENKGQVKDQNNNPRADVKFILALPNNNVVLTAKGFSYDTYVTEEKMRLKSSQTLSRLELRDSLEKDVKFKFHRVDVEFVGANANPDITTEEPSNDYITYYTDGAEVIVYHYGKVRYKNIYPGIDVEFIARPGKSKPIEYNFIVQPGADLNLLQLKYKGAHANRLVNGNLELSIEHGTLSESIPASYGEKTGKAAKVSYREIKSSNSRLINSANEITIGFSGTAMRMKEALVIDPTPSINWGIYVNSLGGTYVWGLTCDDAENVFMAGQTTSHSLIATFGSYQSVFGGSIDVFVQKYTANGILEWGTYFGRAQQEIARGLTRDLLGNLYIIGDISTNVGYQNISTPGADQTTISNIFLAKFTEGGNLIWCTYYGLLNSGVSGASIIYDKVSNNIYATGTSIFGGNVDGFVVKFSLDGIKQWDVNFGGAHQDWFRDITTDRLGDVIISGYSDSDLLATPGTHQTIKSPWYSDAIVAKFSSTGSLRWCTYFGGSSQDDGLAVTTDSDSFIYLSGRTFSSDNVSTNNVKHTAEFQSEGFLLKLNPSGTRVWSTYIGGSQSDDVAINSSNGIYVAGSTPATPVFSTTEAFQRSFGGGASDGFICNVKPDGTLNWWTYYGVDLRNELNLCLDVSQGRLIVAGNFQSAVFHSVPFLASFSDTCSIDIRPNNVLTTQYLCSVKFKVDKDTGCQTSYLWSFGDGFTSNEAQPIHVYNSSGLYDISVRVVTNCSYCQDEITLTKQITFSPTSVIIENRLLEADTDIKNQIITASASTFSDSWPLPHDNSVLRDKNSFVNGTEGVWRNDATYVYDSPRQLSAPTNLAQDGTFTLNHFDWGSAEFNIVPNWIRANTMTQYSPYSYELENRDVLGVYSAALYDYGGHLPSANGVNMRNTEMAFTSFEVNDGKPTGNWMFNNAAQPANMLYKVPVGSGHLVVVDAPVSEFDAVSKVDVSAQAISFFGFLVSGKPTTFLQGVDVLCKQAHPSDPKRSILVLSRAPFESLWFGQLTVNRLASPAVTPLLDNTVFHSGRQSLKIVGEMTFRQELLQLEAGKSYWINAWVSVNNPLTPTPVLGTNLGIEVAMKNRQGTVVGTASFQPVGQVIEGWQQVKGTFVAPANAHTLEVKFKAGSAGTAWFDDLRLQPEKGNMKAYVYDLKDYRLRAILDEENFASLFFYDAEGNLYLTKKETERGIKTITENVSYQIER